MFLLPWSDFRSWALIFGNRCSETSMGVLGLLEQVASDDVIFGVLAHHRNRAQDFVG